MIVEGFVELFHREAAARPGRHFARTPEGPITLADLDRASAALAATLAGRGLGRGDRVAVMMRNSPAALALFYALARAGLVWVPVNAALRGEGLRHVLDHCEPALVVADAEFAPTIVGCGASPAPLWPVTDPGLPQGAPGAAPEGPPPAPGDIAAIMYTSGTTGPAKGVIVTHRMLRYAVEAVVHCADPRPGDVFYTWEPFYHIGGAQVMLLPLVCDVTLALAPRFSASRFWREVRETGSTHIHHLGGIIQILLQQPPGPDDRSHGARIAWGGGCAPAAWRPFEERFGVALRECYGMTEAASITTINKGGEPGSVGRPVPWFEVWLAGADGRPAATGPGEIVLRERAPGAIFPGYFRDPAATARALRPDGFHTGDLGSWDAAGNLRFHGRMGDSVRCRGENVSAHEVESVAALHPGVEDCAMIGVAADVGEQEIKLFVQPAAGARLTPGELSRWLEPRLAPHQRPRFIVLVEGFERTASQRIMKHRLPGGRDGAWDRLSGEMQE